MNHNSYRKSEHQADSMISTTVPDSIASAMMMMQVNTINAFKESNAESLDKQTTILNGMMQLASSIMQYNQQLSESLENAFYEISRKNDQIEKLVEKVIAINPNGELQAVEISVEDNNKNNKSIINRLMGNTNNTTSKYTVTPINHKSKKYLSVEARKTPKEFSDLVNMLADAMNQDSCSIPDLYKKLYAEFSDEYDIDYKELIKEVCSINKLSTCSKSFAICNNKEVYKKFSKFINKKVKQCRRSM